MKIKKIIAALTLCGAMVFPGFKVSAVNSLPTKGYISGTIGTTSVETADNATIGSIVADIDGDAQYQAEWVVTDAGAQSLSSYIALSIPNLTSDGYPDISVKITEVYIDGVKIDYTMSPNAVNTAKYVAGRDPETRVYLFDSVDGTNVADIPQNTPITKSLKVIFTVSGTGDYGTSNIDSNTIPEETTATTSNEYASTDTTTATTVAEPSSTTGDAGIAVAAVVGLTVTAGAAILSKVKLRKKKK